MATDSLESQIAALAERAKRRLTDAGVQSIHASFENIMLAVLEMERCYRAERLLREAESRSMDCWSMCTSDEAPGDGEPDYRCKTCVMRDGLRAQAAALVEES